MIPVLSLVIPAYNEADRLSRGYQRLIPVLEQLGTDRVEVIVVDDGSTDDTLKAAHALYGHLPHAFFVGQPHNKGKGAAVRLGLAAARGDVVAATDADQAINPVHLSELLVAAESADVVAGSRAIDGHIRYDSALRTMAGAAFNALVRHYTGTTLRDTQCGFKGWRRGPGRLLGLLGLIERFAYDAEMLYLAEQLGLRVSALPVTWDDVAGSHVRVGADSLSMIHDVRSLRRTQYEVPVVTLDPGVDASQVAGLAREARVNGLCIARGHDTDLVVLPRDGALGGMGIAAALHGELGTATLADLRGRSFDAV